MEFEALNKIYSNTVDDIIEIGAHNLCMYAREDLDEAQIGYRVDSAGNKLENWIGDEYFVIGDNCNNSEDSCSGNIGSVSRDMIEGRAWFAIGNGVSYSGFIK